MDYLVTLYFAFHNHPKSDMFMIIIIAYIAFEFLWRSKSGVKKNKLPTKNLHLM
jgi:hypothetical protein